MEKYRSMINTVGKKYGIAPALIAAIISRESRAGNALGGWGLMQVDITSTGGKNIPRGGWESEEHLCQGTKILVDFIRLIRDKFPDWSEEEQLKGGIAAYNMGDRNVLSYGGVDEKTTGKDYSNDVVARAQWYKNNGGF